MTEFNRKEIKKMTRFYSTDLGKKIIKVRGQEIVGIWLEKFREISEKYN